MAEEVHRLDIVVMAIVNHDGTMKFEVNGTDLNSVNAAAAQASLLILQFKDDVIDDCKERDFFDDNVFPSEEEKAELTRKETLAYEKDRFIKRSSSYPENKGSREKKT